MSNPEQPIELPKPAGPTLRDWAVFSIGFTFVLMGLFIAWRDGIRESLFVLCFFGVCALVSGYVIVRKLRRRRFKATAVSVAGGVKLHRSSARMLGVAALIAIAVGPFLFMPNPPVLGLVCVAVALGASALLVIGVVSGRFSKSFLRFDQPGLTIGEGKYECLFLWDQIVDLAEFELSDNACVGFNVVNPGAILVTPESARPLMHKKLAANQAHTGYLVSIMPMHFGVHAESLCAAIRNYAANPAARRELVAKLAIEAPS